MLIHLLKPLWISVIAVVVLKELRLGFTSIILSTIGRYFVVYLRI